MVNRKCTTKSHHYNTKLSLTVTGNTRNTIDICSATISVHKNSISFVAIADADRKIIYSNKLMQELLGITPGDSALTKYNHKGSSTLDISAEANRQLQETGIWKGEATIKGKAGTMLPVIQSIYAHKNEKGIIEYYSVTSIEKITPL